MGMTIADVKHCLKVMVDCEVCEECNLYVAYYWNR